MLLGFGVDQLRHAGVLAQELWPSVRLPELTPGHDLTEFVMLVVQVAWTALRMSMLWRAI